MLLEGPRDTMNSKELNVNVPLATVESDSEEFEGFAEFQSSGGGVGGGLEESSLEGGGGLASLGGELDSLTGSLEDLVSTFDEKLTMCFQDYQEQVDKIAPVQVRSQEEIMNECQVWWTLTGNFGNMMPIDWSKTYTRAHHLPTLNLCDPRPTPGSELDSYEEEDDIVAADLDMHQLILNSPDNQKPEPIKSAEEVLQEIDDIIDDDEDEDEDDDDSDRAEGLGRRAGGGLRGSDRHSGGGASFLPPHSIRSSTFIGQALQGRRLEELSVAELTQILADVETLVRELSEELVQDLGVRDELEFEKELKNSFISLLLSIQSKRRQHNIDGAPKKGSRREKGREPKYLTTVIPYNSERGCPSLPTLQVLVKILKSINEDSPAVPALLTDYILKVLCPT